MSGWPLEIKQLGEGSWGLSRAAPDGPALGPAEGQALHLPDSLSQLSPDPFLVFHAAGVASWAALTK